MTLSEWLDSMPLNAKVCMYDCASNDPPRIGVWVIRETNRRIADLEAENRKIVALLQSTMEWINNWYPESPMADPSGEWDEHKAIVDSVLSPQPSAAAQEAPADGGGRDR